MGIPKNKLIPIVMLGKIRGIHDIEGFKESLDCSECMWDMTGVSSWRLFQPECALKPKAFNTRPCKNFEPCMPAVEEYIEDFIEDEHAEQR